MPLKTVHRTVFLTRQHEATATEDGYTGDKVCSACGNTVETGTVIPATGEEPTEPEELTEPTGETEGYHCPYCGQVHPKTVSGWITYILHMLAYLLKSITPLVSHFAAE